MKAFASTSTGRHSRGQGPRLDDGQIAHRIGVLKHLFTMF